MISKILALALLLIAAQLLFGYLMLLRGVSNLDGIYAEFLVFSILVILSLSQYKWLRSVAAIAFAVAIVYCIILAQETSYLSFYIVALLYTIIVVLLFSFPFPQVVKDNRHNRISF